MCCIPAAGCPGTSLRLSQGRCAGFETRLNNDAEETPHSEEAFDHLSNSKKKFGPSKTGIWSISYLLRVSTCSTRNITGSTRPQWGRVYGTAPVGAIHKWILSLSSWRETVTDCGYSRGSNRPSRTPAKTLLWIYTKRIDWSRTLISDIGQRYCNMHIYVLILCIHIFCKFNGARCLLMYIRILPGTLIKHDIVEF